MDRALAKPVANARDCNIIVQVIRCVLQRYLRCIISNMQQAIMHRSFAAEPRTCQSAAVWWMLSEHCDLHWLLVEDQLPLHLPVHHLHLALHCRWTLHGQIRLMRRSRRRNPLEIPRLAAIYRDHGDFLWTLPHCLIQKPQDHVRPYVEITFQGQQRYEVCNIRAVTVS